VHDSMIIAALQGSGSMTEGQAGGDVAPAGPAAMPRPKATPKKTPVFATLTGGAAPAQKRRLSTFGIAGGCELRPHAARYGFFHRLTAG